VKHLYIDRCEPGSSVSIVSGYGLDDRAIEVRSSAEAKDLSSSLCVQTGSGAHPLSCTLGTGGPFAGGKVRPGRDADHSPHLMPGSRRSRSTSVACSGTALAFYILIGAGMTFKNKKKFRCDIPAYTGPFKALASEWCMNVICLMWLVFFMIRCFLNDAVISINTVWHYLTHNVRKYWRGLKQNRNDVCPSLAL
jgi:hypothetical protein